MSALLRLLRVTATPRPAEVATAVARRIGTPVALVMSGMLYFCVVTCTVIACVTLAVDALVKVAFGGVPTQFTFGGLALGIAAGWISFVPFLRWQRRRKLPSLELGRDGVVLDGRITEWKVPDHATPHAVITFEHDGSSLHVTYATAASFAPHTHPVWSVVPVLYSPASKWALVFVDANRPASALVRGKIAPPQARLLAR